MAVNIFSKIMLTKCMKLSKRVPILVEKLTKQYFPKIVFK